MTVTADQLPTTVMRRIGDEPQPGLPPADSILTPAADQLPHRSPSWVPDDGPAAEDLAAWWARTTALDLAAIQAKIEEYSDSDLLLMGTTLCPSGTDDATKVEAACMFYLLGKAARAVGAYQDGRRPSDDTLHDATVYSLMARRARQSGGWPS